MNRFSIRAAVSLLLLVAALCIGRPIFAASPAAVPGFDPKRHMHVDEVQPGMKGYGMTVFHGVKIEPFAVEVISIQQGFSPGKTVVWIRCTDERMQASGPVQGMSGSPIYLWPNADPAKPETQVARKIGEGGRMLGAFAFGHKLGKDCYAGVQPIENMLEAASRAKNQTDEDRRASASSKQQLTAALEVAQQFKLTPDQTWRLAAICKLSNVPELPAVGGALDAPHADPMSSMSSPQHLALPVSVATADQAAMLRPFMAPMGLIPVAAGSAGSPLPPKWIDPDSVKLEPGSVFSVPMAFGPFEMSAIGTATDVLPDGTVVAFGHQFFAQGPIAVPMATGFIHFVQPNISSSFKLGGTLRVTGALVRDEATGVVGKPGAKYPTADAVIHVRFPNASQNRDFKYTLVHHEQLLAGLLGTLASSSMTSDTSPPQLSTTTMTASLKFDNGKTLKLQQIMPGSNPQQIMLGLAAPIAPMIENPFGTAKLENVEATITVEKGIRSADLLSATIEQSVVKPGDDIVIHIRLQPYGKPIELRRLTLKVPDDAKDGQYGLLIGGAKAYHQTRVSMRPHLMDVQSAADLYDAIQQMLDLRDDSLYTVLRLQPANNLAIGRQELAHLPSSRVALLASENSTRATPFVDSVDQVLHMPYAINGQLSLQVNVAQDPEKTP